MSHGKTFEKDMLTSVRSWGWWAERFTDRMWSQGGGSVESPPDMICVAGEGRPILIEMKAVKGKSIPLGRCSGHQLERLLKFPGEAYVLVMFYEGDRAQKRCAVLIPAELWSKGEEQYNRRSLALKDLRRDLSWTLHLTWVGRKRTVGPWVRQWSTAENLSPTQ